MTDYAHNLSDHRSDKAKDALRQAELLLNNDEYDGSINRSYYAIFNSIRSLLALVGIDSRKHTGIISYFDQYFVKTDICDKTCSRIAHSAFDTRQVHDYQDFQVLTYEQAKMQFDDALRFIETVEQKRVLLLDGKISLPTIP
ncbi:MAG: hypothetical protein BWK80_41965 [Desulfobacteraceae bacterium IS3]|nr:MAG: hypothetical protein BWK80_41965 [Desulfobacteraceae bacterium IS3]HAO19917.1 antitoxin [Desulfobacteraceae bacterium]